MGFALPAALGAKVGRPDKAVWCVAGVVALAAVTGGVTLMGRLAQLESVDEESENEQDQQPD